MGQRLTDMTTRRVIIGIFIMLLFVPGFNINAGIYGDYPCREAGRNGVRGLEWIACDGSGVE